MEIANHPQIRCPEDSTVIWRYMDFAKFVDLLETNCLYFNRTDNFKDSFEGTIPEFNLKKIWLEKFKNPRMYDALIKVFAGIRAQTYVNCWHINDYESAAMWDLYRKNGDGIAIKSTCERIKRCFLSTETPIIGEVDYIDYKNHAIADGNVYFAIFTKRKSFEHEKELRVMYHKKGLELTSNNCEIPVELGIPFEVDLNILIDKIYVSPE